MGGQLSVIGYQLEGVGFWGFRVLVEFPISPFPHFLTTDDRRLNSIDGLSRNCHNSIRVEETYLGMFSFFKFIIFYFTSQVQESLTFLLV